MKKIVCLSASFSGNKGACAMLESAIESLSKKFPDSQFYVMSPFPKADIQANPYSNAYIYSASPFNLVFKYFPLSILNWLFKKIGIRATLGRELKILNEADYVLDLAGISFSDGRELFLIFNVFSILPAMLMNKKVIKCSQALGSFNSPLNNFFARLILPKMHLIVARGRQTQRMLEVLGLKNVIFGADLAFDFFISESLKEEMRQKFHDENFFGKKIAGIAPSSVVEKKCQKIGVDYVQVNVDFINYLLSRDFNVLIIPHSFSKSGNNSHRNFFHELIHLAKKPRADSSLCENIYNLVSNKESVKFINEDLDPRQLRALIGQCNIFLASRFHSMISALTMKIPLLICGWGHKYLEVLDEFSLADYCFSYRELSTKNLVEKFEKVRANHSDILGKMEANLSKAVDSSREYLKYIN